MVRSRWTVGQAAIGRLLRNAASMSLLALAWASLPRLRELWEQPDLPDQHRLRVGLALLAGDSRPVNSLREGMFQAEPQGMAPLKAQQQPQADEPQQKMDQV